MLGIQYSTVHDVKLERAGAGYKNAITVCQIMPLRKQRLQSTEDSCESQSPTLGRKQFSRNSKNRETAEQVEISTSSPRVILCDPAQSSFKICFQAFVSATEELRLAVSQDLLDSINAEPGSLRFLSVPEKENAIKRIPFSE
ncbi:hypothetical protein TNCV_1142161 [Trichonephila clavipes]|nr:hypothetical protein TNCV_1142161 [Trichonephila clavipes]